MLKRLKELFDGDSKADVKSHPVFQEKHLAAAALLVEAATLDGEFEDAERQTILTILQNRFHFNAEDAEALTAEASQSQDQSTHLLRFTRAIKDHYSESERIELIEMLWEVAYADGIIHDYESNLMRRIGGLIYVSDRDRGEARKRVAARLGYE